MSFGAEKKKKNTQGLPKNGRKKHLKPGRVYCIITTSPAIQEITFLL